MGWQLNNSTRVEDHAISVCAGRYAQIASPVPTNTSTASLSFILVLHGNISERLSLHPRAAREIELKPTDLPNLLKIVLYYPPSIRLPPSLLIAHAASAAVKLSPEFITMVAKKRIQRRSAEFYTRGA